jgi:hypothetical protein
VPPREGAIPAELLTLDRYRIRRKFFQVFGASFHVYDPAGRVIGFSKQAAFRQKEDIRDFADEAMSTPLLTIRSRQIVDFSAAYDVVDATEYRKVGAARRTCWSSILRDAWELLDEGDRPVASIREESGGLAFARRFLTNLIPQSFEVKDASGVRGEGERSRCSTNCSATPPRPNGSECSSGCRTTGESPADTPRSRPPG